MARRKAVIVAIEDQTVAFLLENPGATRDQIARGIGIGKYDKSARIYQCLRRMEHNGHVESFYADRQYMAGPLHYRLTRKYIDSMLGPVSDLPPLVTITAAKRNAKPPKRRNKKRKGK